MQPLADGFKLMLKEALVPSTSNKLIFLLSPVLSFFISLMGWSVIPFDTNSFFSNIDAGILYILAMSSLGVYGIILAGWSSNSKYSFLGALRSSAQMISYELSLGFSISCILLYSGSFNLNKIIYMQSKVWFFIPLFIPFVIFFIASLAETNRHPFDLPEAEAELVSGYNVEYSGMGFALFSLAEYSNILIMCFLNSIFFFGGWLHLNIISNFLIFFFFWIPEALIYPLKVLFFLTIFIIIRAILPRYRYDQLMMLGWKILLPIIFSYVLFSLFIVKAFNIYPY